MLKGKGGLIVLVLLVALLLVLFLLNFLQTQQKEHVPFPAGEGGYVHDGPLGVQDAVCSGPERFPCNPGLVCNTTDHAMYGYCVTDTRPIHPPAGEGESCDSEVRCDPGLRCEIAPGAKSGTCVRLPVGDLDS